MKVEISVPEVVEIFKEIQEQPEKLFEMIRFDIRETVGQYLTAMMNAELTHFLGRKPYERGQGEVNHRNGSYDRGFTLKGIGEVQVGVPRDRKGKFKTQVMPRSRQYEEEISRGLSLMFLTGISTRSLSMISNRLIGRSISHTEVSSANAELTEAVEKWRMRDLSEESIKYLFVDGVSFPMRIDGTIQIHDLPISMEGYTRGGNYASLRNTANSEENIGTIFCFYRSSASNFPRGMEVRGKYKSTWIGGDETSLFNLTRGGQLKNIYSTYASENVTPTGYIGESLQLLNLSQWYIENFSEYPKNRKALIPFIK